MARKNEKLIDFGMEFAYLVLLPIIVTSLLICLGTSCVWIANLIIRLIG